MRFGDELHVRPALRLATYPSPRPVRLGWRLASAFFFGAAFGFLFAGRWSGLVLPLLGAATFCWCRVVR